MRFLHTSDWHLGRRLHGFDLQAEQADAFSQIEQIALAQQVDGVIVAGDLYDRSLPAEQSVRMLNQQFKQLNLVDHLPLYVIAGNHDSATRLATGASWYQQTHLYVATQLAQAFTPVELTDTQIFLLPYFEPFAARQYFHDEQLQTLQQAIVPVFQKMKQVFDPAKKHVLVAHFFVAGSSQTTSETPLTVGGLAAIPSDLLADFDYVALGHLHGKDALQLPNARYSGSPIKFSLSETTQQKGVWIVDTEPFWLQFYPLKLLHDVIHLTQSFQTLTDESYYQKQDLNNYFGITLTDRQIIPNLLSRLRTIYPKLLTVERQTKLQLPDSAKSDVRQLQQQDPMDLLTDFYEQVAQVPLTKQQQQWATQALQLAQKEVQ
ncbi:exonuclease SbcCD subunit D [Bombilactobacillus folatiphilus]|uniref:Nuclease SbcCD subunit D n=1 Tax=Bombilactobacillus folatiphilus TaxID=2923362 RepID=A0ABY4P9B3_9LACO|nr:exonuclease SbcCD subunit D [Bombilactobacillus folatiphilus]UQS82184.1 exonuclease SbcCD subunit D [Bombilactobacillus folatiphilus]